METVFEKTYAKITVDTENKVMYVVWNGFITSEQYREVFIKLLDLLKEHKIVRLLTDTRKQGVISPTDRKWLETEIVPEAVKNGLKYSATVVTKDVFKQYYMNEIVNSSKQKGMEDFRLFDDDKEAKEWLLSMPL